MEKKTERCGELVQKCLDVGVHRPPCTCDLPKGHEGELHGTRRGGR